MQCLSSLNRRIPKHKNLKLLPDSSQPKKKTIIRTRFPRTCTGSSLATLFFYVFFSIISIFPENVRRFFEAVNIGWVRHSKLATTALGATGGTALVRIPPTAQQLEKKRPGNPITGNRSGLIPLGKPSETTWLPVSPPQVLHKCRLLTNTDSTKPATKRTKPLSSWQLLCGLEQGFFSASCGQAAADRRPVVRWVQLLYTDQIGQRILLR